jgi:hypothetical protein
MDMAKYTVRLIAKAQHGLPPQYEVDAQSDLHASALAIRHFTRMGNDVPKNALLDVETDNQGLQTLSVESVQRWLKRDNEGLAFAKEEGFE